jgi:hypothetical protein
MKTGNIKDIVVDTRLNNIHISLDRATQADDTLLIVLLKSLLPGAVGIEVRINDVVTGHLATECDSDIALKIPLSSKADQIRILSQNLRRKNT